MARAPRGAIGWFESLALIDPSIGLEAAAKIAVYFALFLVVGACGARWLSRRHLNGAPDEPDSPLEERLRRVLLAGCVALASGLVARVWAHTVAAFGVSEAWSWDALRVVTWESEWGTGWRVQASLAVMLVGIALIARGGRARWGWMATGVLAAAMSYAVPLLGHAEGEAARVALHGSHVLAAGLWFGTLAVLWLVHPTRASLARDLARFSPLALSAAAVAGVTGAVALWTYVGALSNLWVEPWGRTLLLKVVVVAGAALCGLANWRSYRHRSAADGQTLRLAPLVTAELLLAGAVVLLTGVLTELPHP